MQLLIITGGLKKLHMKNSQYFLSLSLFCTHFSLSFLYFHSLYYTSLTLLLEGFCKISFISYGILLLENVRTLQHVYEEEEKNRMQSNVRRTKYHFRKPVTCFRCSWADSCYGNKSLIIAWLFLFFALTKHVASDLNGCIGTFL